MTRTFLAAAPGRSTDLAPARAAGHCLCIGPDPGADLVTRPGDTWQSVEARLPAGFAPDFLLLDLSYNSFPSWAWTCPLPRVALAPDWDLQWTFFRLALPRCALAFTDRRGVRALRAAKAGHAFEANLFGLQGLFATPLPEGPEPPRDIDLLFVGNVNPAIQGERLPWLGRLARLADRHRVVIATGVRGEDYRRLLRRARIVFNRALKGEWNQRVAEAASCGALLLQEAENPATAGVWRDGENCALYTTRDLEDVVERYMADEPLRATVAAYGRAMAHQHPFAAELTRILETVDARWDEVQARHAALPALAADGDDLLLLRFWQAMGAQSDDDRTLHADLESARSRNGGPPWAALALAALSGPDDPRRSAGWLHASLARAPRSALLALGLVEALAACGETRLAIDGARRLLTSLLDGGLPPAEDLWPLPTASFGTLRVGWERAGWRHAADPEARRRDRTDLVRWRLHAILAGQTGDLAHYHEAAHAWPDAPGVRAALGCALGRAGRPAEAAAHLRAELDANPFDAPAARALFQALREAGLADTAARLVEERRLLHVAAPRLVPEEGWFTAPPSSSQPPMPVTATPTRPTVEGPLAVAWEGALFACHSLGHVNRQLVLGLDARGLRLLPRDIPSPAPDLLPGTERSRLQALCAAANPAGPTDVTVRHSWPPDDTPPAWGHWVVMQPWEFGSVPKDWLIWLAQVDEVWVPTTFVARAFFDAGVPPERVRVVPLGADPELFRPGCAPLALTTAKPVKLLYVGGTIARKGIDVLLEGYRRAFTRSDGVCLVVKDMGGSSFYRGQTAQALLDRFRAEESNPEVLYLDRDMNAGELAGLYAACDVLCAPYRGEGFGLPIAEAMSAGLPVVVTGHGAALDFVDEAVGWLVPARVVPLPQDAVGGQATVGTPYLAEPDVKALAAILREVVSSADERRRRGAAGRERVLQRLTWGHAADAAAMALREVASRPVRRFADHGQPTGPVARVRGQVIHLYEPAKDRWISRPLLNGQPYEPYQTDLMLALVKEGDRVLDVGANVGHHALLLAAKVGPAGRVYVVEPHPGNLELLRRGVADNGHANVTVLPVAASNHGGTARLHLCADNQGDHRLFASEEQRPSVEVACARLDDLIPDAAPLALVKIDVQGAEGLALKGMRSLLLRSPGVRLVMELWPWGLRKAGTPTADVLRWLSELGFSFAVIDERQRRAAPADAAALLAGLPEREDAFVNLLCTRQGADAPAVVAGREGVAAYAPGVSLCVIAKDEEHNIGDCLDSACGLFDEVVVVDTGSKDRTKEIATTKGAKVFDFPWIDHFAAARNAALERATKRWIFWLDADDRLDADNRQKLRALIASLPDANVAYSMKCRCLPDAQSGSATVVDHIRLFRNGPAVRWRYRIHEQILPALREAGAEVRFADVVIDHTGYVDPALRGRKLQRDLRLLQLQHKDMGDEPFTLFNLGATYLELGRAAEALPLLENSLAKSHRRDSIVRKLHSLIASSHARLGRPQEALEACVRGQADCPGDPELLLVEGTLRSDAGDLAGAKAALLRLLGAGAVGQQAERFASVAEGLSGFRARSQLASVSERLGEVREAESLWRQAAAEAPSWWPAWSGLAGLMLAQRRWRELEEAASGLEKLPDAAGEAAWWRGRGLLERDDAVGAVRLLSEALAARPEDVSLALLHGRALGEGGDLAGAERALLALLERRPDDPRARQELEALRARLGTRDAAFLDPRRLR